MQKDKLLKSHEVGKEVVMVERVGNGKKKLKCI